MKERLGMVDNYCRVIAIDRANVKDSIEILSLFFAPLGK
ncbi:hypothetical protein LLNZ_00050 [Lactococcus cremoris subsp. cremoris NZ9000]|nr:hypothetical protein LLNZ_00050 [Lactococcus cremoris subsp. cremoris NZ9000]